MIRRLQSRAAAVAGITLYMQAVQDLAVEDRVSRTQYQYSLEHPDQAQLDLWSGRLLDALRREPALQDVATDQQTGGVRADVTIDRDTASRFGISASDVDDALYSAFGQRQISTIFTQLNQYHVVLELKPEYRRGPDALNDVYVPRQRRRAGAAPGLRPRSRRRARRSPSITRDSSPRPRCRSISRPARRSARR